MRVGVREEQGARFSTLQSWKLIEASLLLLLMRDSATLTLSSERVEKMSFGCFRV